jgi:hypothetical protein
VESFAVKVAEIRFRSRSEFSATVEALGEACDRYRDAQGLLDTPRTLMMTAIITALRRRTPGSGIAIQIADEYAALARETLGDHPKAEVFER